MLLLPDQTQLLFVRLTHVLLIFSYAGQMPVVYLCRICLRKIKAPAKVVVDKMETSCNRSVEFSEQKLLK